MTIARLVDVRASESSTYGSKAANLGGLAHAGANVPEGIALSIDMGARFVDRALDELGVGSATRSLDVVATMDNDDLADLRARAQNIALSPSDEGSLAELLSRDPGVRFAVRSSANAEDSRARSFAGLFDTFLGIQADAVSDRVKACWLAVFSPRIVAYCRSQSLALDEIAVGVVVQELVDADVSGVCFTVDPVTGENDELVVEAVLGLGESLVSGLADPDSYRVRKSTREVVERHAGVQTTSVRPSATGTEEEEVEVERRSLLKLHDGQLLALAAACIDIEQLFSGPQDIEFAFVGDELFILQSRPITSIR